jgi:hypothetical protein
MKRIGLAILVAFANGLGAHWTVMVYMGADNELHDQAYNDLEELSSVGSSAEVKVIVQLDDQGPSTRRYFIEPGQAVLVESLPELDMADPSTLSDFVRFCAEGYPAERYFLILWGHGNGWRESISPGMIQAIIYDWSSDHSMGVAGGELRSALERIRAHLGRPLDLLGFDACAMAMVEVALEAAGLARVLIGSAGPTPWDGWSYDGLLRSIKADPAASPQMIASKAVDCYLEYYRDKGFLADISALDLSRLSQAISDLDEMCRGSMDQKRFKAVRELVQTFPSGREPTPRVSDPHIDLIDLLERLGVKNGLAAAVVASGSIGYETANGLAIWFPYHYLGFKRDFREYELLKFAEQVGWLKFLNRYYGQDDLPPAQPALIRADLKGNSYRLYWSTAQDLARVSYELREVQRVYTLLQDSAETDNNWDLQGFERSADNPHTGRYSFFSGRGANLDNRLSLRMPITLAEGGLLSFWCRYQTEENYDWGSGQLKRDILYLELSDDNRTWWAIDSLYGESDGFKEFRYFLSQASSLYLRFRYKTDGTDDLAGAYIDDLTIQGFEGLRLVVEDHLDTSFYFYEKPHGQYRYGVVAKDEFGNQSPVSELFSVVVRDYAPPYSIPSPFLGKCQIYCDHPDELEPGVRIYTLSGELVCEFPEGTVKNHRLDWDGKNQAGKEVAAGIYLVEVEGEEFRCIGKIVKVR